MNCWFVLFIFRAREMVDISWNNMALMLKVYKKNLPPSLSSWSMLTRVSGAI